LAVPYPQYWVNLDGEPIYRLDLAYPHAKIAIEYDGEAHHTHPSDRRRDEIRRAWLRAHGWRVIVVTKDSFTPEAVAAWIGELRIMLAGA
jgi:very-short-patch-repair endonuclease